ncbi:MULTISPECIES: GTPase family protein [unclassified Halorhodospira]|uniref:GTPase family protein n=1 Tax=unclassified Halorhodospira TaxID=2626748 RepID=UPI001EE98B75|nr:MULTISPECIES: dynamin family protein [unclassified Halorhodospira]MCG5539725.1 dynamin family protein [Halorhodospira sp. M39old]MCG5545535.1 dynamin family protein [Halorhodospira sp. M38]
MRRLDSSSSGVATRGTSDVDTGLETLEALHRLGAGRLPPTLVDEMADVQGRARERLARSRDHVVIAVAGGTGSGKSSLVNALVGEEVSAPGVRRPTTDHAVAVTVGEDDRVAALLDWLQVFERRSVPDGRGRSDLDGAVLLDLPDMDSVVQDHWAVAERLIERCDLLLWVVDPLKYAHALAHEGYFARLAHHAEVLMVALNHADRLTPSDRDACLEHLRELLGRQGLQAVELLATDAVGGEGVSRLAERIAARVHERRAPLERLRADVTELISRSAACLPDPERLELDGERLVTAQRQAVNEAELLAGAAGAYRQAGMRAVASPLKRLLGALFSGLRGRPAVTAVATSALPRPKVAEPLLRDGLLQAIEPAAARLPEPAAERLRSLAVTAAVPRAGELRGRLGELAWSPRPRLWWRGVGALRGASEAAALFGGLWLVTRGGAEWLALPSVPAPAVAGEISWPFALLAGGSVASLLLGWLGRALLGPGGRRHARRLAGQLAEAVAGADGGAMADVHEELASCQRLSARTRSAATEVAASGRR